MGRLTRDEVRVERMLRAARSVAVLGASARRGEPSEAIVEYLKDAGFEVFPVRPDRADVAGLRSSMRVADVPGALDVVLVLGGGGVDRAMVEEAARKGARALWLAPGVSLADDAAAHAAASDLLLVRDRDITTEYRHTVEVAGQPSKRGVHVGRRKRQYEDDRKRHDETGYAEGGGGGGKGGGGNRAVLDEKKMVGGKPSPRRGPLRRPR